MINNYSLFILLFHLYTRRDIIERIDRMMGLILSRLVDSKHEV